MFKLTQVFRIRMGTAPSYLSSNFKPLSQTHDYGTRQRSYNYFVSKELANSPFSFTFTAATCWNSLPVCLKQIDTLGSFKTRLKQYLSSNWFLLFSNGLISQRLDLIHFILFLLHVVLEYWYDCTAWKGPHWKKVERLNWAILRISMLLHLYHATIA